LNILLITSNDEKFQKIKKINELAANSLVWYKFMEDEVNPLHGKGGWKNSENLEIFYAFWNYIKKSHINIIEYEMNFVSSYEKLLASENSVNNFYEGNIRLLNQEMRVTKEGYKIEVLT